MFCQKRWYLKEKKEDYRSKQQDINLQFNLLAMKDKLGAINSQDAEKAEISVECACGKGYKSGGPPDEIYKKINKNWELLNQKLGKVNKNED